MGVPADAGSDLRRRAAAAFASTARGPAAASETRDLHFVGGPSDPVRVADRPRPLPADRDARPRARARTAPRSGSRGRARRFASSPFSPPRVIELQGIASADLHVHAQASDDSAMPNAARLASFVAEGVDLIVSSDHDHLGEYGPRWRRSAWTGGSACSRASRRPAARRAGRRPGRWAIPNAWPIPFLPTAHRRGAPPTQDRTLAELYAELRGEYGARVVQLNHPMGKRRERARRASPI